MSSPQNVILIFDLGTKALLREVIPDTFEQESIMFHNPLANEGAIKVPLSVYWAWGPQGAAANIAAIAY